MKNPQVLILAALAALVIGVGAPRATQAAEEHDHDHEHGEHETHAPKYGGIVQEVGGLQYELVLKPEATRVYVDDHGKKVSVKGAKATVTLLKGTQSTKVVLLPAGDNVLEAKPGVPDAKGMRAIAVVLMRGKESTVRFDEKK